MKKNLQQLYFTIACLLCSVGAYAIPANPNPYVVTQPDGTAITLQLCGDEFYHYYITEDGAPVTLCEDGFYRYTTIDAQNNLVASADVVGKMSSIAISDKQSVLKRHGELYKVGKAKRAVDIEEVQAPMRRIAKKAAAGNGVVKGIIVLAEFQDQKFTISQSAISNKMNKEGYTDEYGSIGSARDYFIAQSYGQFKPEFNVVGPVTLSRNMAYYGGNENGGSDVRPDVMVSEACQLASQQGLVNMSDYDSNGDGWVDLVYVIYAGYPESSGAPSETIWPHAWNIYYGAGRTVKVDGVQLGAYACSSELSGNSGGKLDGIGSFCHEYSHTLGLPDWYDIDYSGAMGMSWWSVMASGNYGVDGYVPVGYNAYEREFCGWLELNELTEEASITMPELNTDKNAAYKITSTNPNQYITLETRCKSGWDIALPAEGMMVVAVDYDQNAWDRNGPNDDPDRQRFKLIPADNRWSDYNLYGDLYPYGGNTSLTSTSLPKMQVYNTIIKGKPITGIEYSNGVTTFDFMKEDAPADDHIEYTYITPGQYTWSYEIDNQTYVSETTFDSIEQFDLSLVYNNAEGMVGTNWSISGLFEELSLDYTRPLAALSYETSLSNEPVEVMVLADIYNADFYYFSSVGTTTLEDDYGNNVTVDLYLANLSGSTLSQPQFVVNSENEFVFDSEQLVLFFRMDDGNLYLYNYLDNPKIVRGSDIPGDEPNGKITVDDIVGTYNAYAQSAFQDYPDEEWTVTIKADENDANKVWIQPVCTFLGNNPSAEYLSPVYAIFDASNSTLNMPLGQVVLENQNAIASTATSLDGVNIDLESQIVMSVSNTAGNLVITFAKQYFFGYVDINDLGGGWYQALHNISYKKTTPVSDDADEVPEYLENTYQAKGYDGFYGNLEEWSVNITIDRNEKGKVWIHPLCLFGGLSAEYINPVYATYNAEDNTLIMPLGQVLYEDSQNRIVLVQTTDGSDKNQTGNVVMKINQNGSGCEITFANDCFIGLGDFIYDRWWYEVLHNVTFSTIKEGDEVPEYLEDTFMAKGYNGYDGSMEEWSVNITIDRNEKGKVWIQPICLISSLSAEDISPVYATYNAEDNTLIMPLAQLVYEDSKNKVIVVQTTDGSDKNQIGNVVMQINETESGYEITFADDYYIGLGDLYNDKWWYQVLYNISYSVTKEADEVPEYLEDTYQAIAYNGFDGNLEGWSVNITIDRNEKGKVWIQPLCLFANLDTEYISPVYATYNAEDNTLIMPLGQVLYEDSQNRIVFVQTTDGSDKNQTGNVVMQINETEVGYEITFADDYYIGVGDFYNDKWWYQVLSKVEYTNVTCTNHVIYDDVESYEIHTSVQIDTVTYVRNFDNTDWQPWYVPFDVPYETLAAEFEVAYLNNVHQYDDNNDGVVELTELEVIKVTNGILQANYPYIVKAIIPGEKEIVVEDATVFTLQKAYDCASMLHRYYFIGTYNALSSEVLQEYNLYTLQQNMLEEHTDAMMPLGAFRWYLQIEDRGNAVRPQQIILKVRSNPTDVEDVMGDGNDAPIEYYDLSGRRVEQPTHGIYIMKQGDNVRKVVVNKQ